MLCLLYRRSMGGERNTQKIQRKRDEMNLNCESLYSSDFEREVEEKFVYRHFYQLLELLSDEFLYGEMLNLS